MRAVRARFIFFRNVRGFGCPDERFGLVVILLDGSINSGDEFLNVAKYAAADALMGWKLSTRSFVAQIIYYHRRPNTSWVEQRNSECTSSSSGSCSRDRTAESRRLAPPWRPRGLVRSFRRIANWFHWEQISAAPIANFSVRLRPSHLGSCDN